MENNKVKRKLNKNDIANVVMMILLAIVYVGSVIYAIIEMVDPSHMTRAQARIVLLQCLGGVVLTFCYPIVERLFHVSIKFPIRLGINIFAFMGIFLGETCQLYYYVPIWDDILHTVSGFGIAMLGFCIVSYLFKGKEMKHKTGLMILSGFMLTLSCGLIWEIYEFTFDQIMGLNMQKAVPVVDGIFNGGNSTLPLNGTDAELAEFFRSPAGYRYALLDTMGDLIECFSGGLVCSLILLIVSHYKEMSSFESVLERKEPPYQLSDIADKVDDDDIQQSGAM